MARPRRIDSRDLVIGAAAGIAATIAMTLAADRLHRRLPRRQRYPLPPRELTERSARAVGLAGRLDEPELQAASLASHFAFGAGAGALYPALCPARPRHPVASGVGYGLAVWTASYFGWVPGLGLLRPADEHPRRRTALMVAVHVVWGGTLGLLSDRLGSALGPIEQGPLRDAEQPGAQASARRALSR